MLDIKTIRERTGEVRAVLKIKRMEADLDGLLALDQSRRALLTEVDAMKNQRNVVSKQLGEVKKGGGDIAGPQQAMRALGDRIADMDRQAAALEAQLQDFLLRIPNLPHAGVPAGAGSEQNVIARTWGEPRAFAFKPQGHVALGEALGLLDFERAARLAGAGFPLYVGLGARLERALIQFMLDLHTREHGYTEVSTPFVVNRAAMTGTGQLPKMAEDMYHVDADDLWLIPTAEVPVTNIYREEIIQRPLPIYLTAYSPCFRREAGAAGRETRGLIRVHQFDKVEMVKFVAPENSYDELEKLVRDAEDVLQRLGLCYRVLLLCQGDLSFAAAKCYDIELWAPGQNAWLEVSSCSNFEDFQARRAQIRYRDATGKVRFVHTLNGSGVALARLVVAILENYQEADGSITIPEALRPYFGGLAKIAPPPKP
ncbi:MAG: serine--tRNA ligase [Kiritimatiellaeota bacterium]|nr:serine--tRNA ligase [Kiritimatiellota bacterium]